MTAERHTVALYVGGLLGPLGGGVTAVMLPELAASLHVSIATAGTALTAYFVPFAALQLVSGTLGERWGRQRVTRTAYVAYVLASLLCAVATAAPVFLLGRVLQGLANAFTTPLLVAGLAELVAAERLSRSLGLFGACQAAGQSLAPLVGGVANALSWRWAFVAVAAVAAVLALLPPRGDPRPGVHAPRFRALVTRRMALISAAGFASYAGGAGLPFLVSLLAERRFGTRDAVVGFVVVGFGVAGILLARTWGVVSGRIGAATATAIGLVGGGLAVAAVGVSRPLAVLVVTWTVAGAFSSLATVGLQNLGAREVPTNRGGAVSVVSAFRFTGGAVAPLLWLPLYPAHGDPTAVFVAAGAVAVAGGLVAVLLLVRKRPGTV